MPEAPDFIHTKEPDYEGYWFARMQRQMCISCVITTPISICFFILLVIFFFLIAVVFENYFIPFVVLWIFFTICCCCLIIAFCVPTTVVGFLYDWGPGGCCQICFAIPCALFWAVFSGWWLIDNFDYVAAISMIAGAVLFCIFVIILGIVFIAIYPWYNIARMFVMDLIIESTGGAELHPLILFFLPRTSQSADIEVVDIEKY